VPPSELLYQFIECITSATRLASIRTFGSVLIVFDRLFGAFADAPREEPLRFGLKRREAGQNPFTNALGEWRKLLADIVHAPGLTAKLKTVFGAP
jgi:hypothetical protein